MDNIYEKLERYGKRWREMDRAKYDAMNQEEKKEWTEFLEKFSEARWEATPEEDKRAILEWCQEEHEIYRNNMMENDKQDRENRKVDNEANKN